MNTHIIERLCAVVACLLLAEGCAAMIPTPIRTQTFHVNDPPPIAFQRAMQTAEKLNGGLNGGRIQHDATSGTLLVTNIVGESLSIVVLQEGSGSRLELTGKPVVYTPWADGGIQRFIDTYCAQGANL